MRIIALGLIVSSCFSFRSKKSAYELDEERMMEAVPMEDEPAPKRRTSRVRASYPLEIEVNWRQWLCCWDLCGKKNNLYKINKSAASRYMECTCKDGRRFEVRKMKKKAKIKPLNKYEGDLIN